MGHVQWRTVLVGALVVCACSEETNAPITRSDIVVQLPHDSLFYGRSVRITAIATDDSVVMTDERFTWSSSDTTVAIVDSTARIIGVGIGTARISASSRGNTGHIELRVVPHQVDGGVTFAQGSISSNAECALTAAGTAYCRRGDFRPQDSLQVLQKLPGADTIALTELHTTWRAVCGLSAPGNIYCWGGNDHYVFASAVPQDADAGPIRIRTSLTFSTMSASGHASICAVHRADNDLYCWGHNDIYQLGRGPRIHGDSNIARTANNFRASSVSGSHGRACALDVNGFAYCWANGSRLSLGVAGPDTGVVVAPTPVLGEIRFSSISTSDYSQCAIAVSGDAYCWGGAPAGPQRVPGNLKFKSIATLRSGACAITLANDAYCWGEPIPRDIRETVAMNSRVPFHVMPGTKFRAFSFYEFHEYCGITIEGRAVCWQ